MLLVACSTLLVGILFSNEEEKQIPAAQTPVSNGGADVSGAKVNEIVDTPKSSGSKHRSLARGVSGLPMEETPALVGASRGHVECDVDVDELVYWNEPQGQRDIDFKSPFATQSEKTKYITFEPDRGGWNNIRMNLENIFIFAAATGRTLVLPPASPLYLLNVSVLVKDISILRKLDGMFLIRIISHRSFRKIKQKSTKDLWTSFLCTPHNSNIASELLPWKNLSSWRGVMTGNSPFRRKIVKMS